MAVTRLKSERCNRQRRSGSRVERSPARNLGCGSLRTNTPGKYDHWYCSDRRTQSQRRKLIVWRKNNQPVSHGPWCQGLWHCSLRSPLIILSNWQPFDGKVHKQYSKCKLIINIRVNIGTSISKNTNTNIKKTSRFPHSIKSHKHHQASDGQISDLGSIKRKENTNLVNSCGKMWGRIRAKHVHRQEEVIPGTPLAPLVTWSQSCSPLEKHHNHPVGQRGVQVAIRAPEQQFGIQKFEEQGRYNG